MSAPLRRVDRIEKRCYATKRANRETPDLMTRFREEHYATRAHKAFTCRERNQEATPEAVRRTHRALYLQKSLQVRAAVQKATQVRMDL